MHDELADKNGSKVREESRSDVLSLKQVELVSCIHGFCIREFNHPEIKIFFKKFHLSYQHRYVELFFFFLSAEQPRVTTACNAFALRIRRNIEVI